jgi:cytochrome c553
MHYFYQTRLFASLLFFLFIWQTSSLLSSRAYAQIKLPIEVIGPDGYTEAVSFNLSDAANIDALYLKAHRLAYRDASTNPGRGAKGSVKLNDGPWVDMDNSTVSCYAHEAAYGCLSGAYHTIRFTLPIQGAKTGANTLYFRFNGTDDFSSGYRILEMNLLKGQQTVLPQSAFMQDDPNAWVAPLNNSRDIQKGKEIWQTAQLAESPNGPAIKATCGSCHAADGRDLEYYAFSNWSIQERAEFHGLNATQAQQIASYIRSLKSSQGIQRLGRPWNPPYQPGPGLDNKPVEAWAAGAGLEWVLDDDKDMLAYLFPEGTSQEAIQRATANLATHNVRETPVALQLPDWQAWLPEVHPADIWGSAFDDTRPATAYQAARDALSGGGANTMRQDQKLVRQGKLLEILDEVRTAARDFVRSGGAQPCRNDGVHGSEGFQMLGRPATAPAKDQWDDADVCERPLRAITHWNAVKHWEVMHEFDLEDATADVYAYGEARGWVGSWRQVFELAPHRIGNDSYSLVHLNRAGGSYFNTAWYQLQLVLNAGNRNPRGHFPPDWKYHLDHLFRAALDNQHPQPLRQVQALVKMQQNLDIRLPDGMSPPADYLPYQTDRGPNSYGWWILHVTPWRFLAVGDFSNDADRFQVWNQLNDVEPGLKNKVQNALLKHWLDKTESYAQEDWVRGTALSQLTPADYIPTPYDEARDGKRIGGGTYADNIYRTVPLLREAGVSEALVERLRLWGKMMWPLGDWDALKPGTSITIYAAGNLNTERMALKIDGKTVKTWTNIQGNASDGKFVAYQYTTQESVSASQLQVAYTNDQGKRDLRVDKILINKTTYQSEAATTYSTGTWSSGKGCGSGYKQSEWLHCNGYFAYGQSNARIAEEEKSKLKVSEAIDQLLLFPNPVQNVLYLRLPAYQGPVTVSLMDMAGREVLHYRQIGGKEIELPVQQLSHGLYQVSVQMAGQRIMQKLIVGE